MKKYKVQIYSEEYSVDVDNEFISIGGKRCNIDSSLKEHRTLVKRLAENQYEVWVKNYRIPVSIQNEKSALLAQMQRQSTHQHELTIKAPMPGLVVVVEVQVGDVVAPGNGLIILEAMKMENEIRSPVKARVKKIDVQKTSRVEKGQILIHLEPVE